MWSSIYKCTSLTGRFLFDQHFADEANAYVHEKRKANSINHHKHAGMWKTQLKEKWDVLSDEEKEEWNVKARKLKEARKEEQIYRYDGRFFQNALFP